MARKFITEKEIAYIDRINKELIQDFVGQEILYYAINTEVTNTHRLYNESIEKTWYSPVRINARVTYDSNQVSTTMFGIDTKFNVEVYFHNKELEERNVEPRTGDFLEFGQMIYEITSVTLPQLVYGQIEKKIMTKCICIPSRETQFGAGTDSTRDIDNTHPREFSKSLGVSSDSD